MKKVLFAKYNKTRKSEYQISTVLYESLGNKYAEKKALTIEAKKHIQNFEENYKRLKKIYKNLIYLKPDLDKENNFVIFPFIEGKSVDTQIIQYSDNKEKLLAEIYKCFDIMFEINEEYLVSFEKNQMFIDIFGDVDLSDEMGTLESNIDMILDNIIISDNKYFCLDYEWVATFPVPIKFLKFRCLMYFYQKYQNNLEKLISFKDLLTEIGISEKDRDCYTKMEMKFQKFIHGENYEARYTDLYKKDICKFSELLFLKEEVKRYREEEIISKEKRLKSKEEVFKSKEEELKFRAEMLTLETRLVKLQEEIKANAILIKELKMQVRDKDRHIYNLESAYGIYIRLSRSLVVRGIRKSFRISKKILRRMKKAVYLPKLSFPTYSQPKVSIIIPVYNQFDYTYECLKSILTNTSGVEYEVIIADDLSTDKTKNIKRHVKGITVVRNQKNLKFLLNCNNATNYAKGKYILFLNNDTQVTESWLSSLVQLLESNEEIGMVGSKLVYPDGTLQEAGGIIWSDATGWNYGRNDDPQKPEYNYVREVDYISGASILIKKDLWNQIGGFDELFAPAYCEDSDLAFQVRKLGYRVMYQPASIVIHYEGISNGIDLNSGIKKYQVENNQKFREKWKNELQSQYPSGQNPFSARERNHNKKIILVVDHYVPTFDKDAGSKTTFQYIKMFISKGYLVKFIGDNYAKEEPYTSIFQQMGVEVLYGDWYKENIFDWIIENQKHIHFAYLNRPHITAKYIDIIKNETDIKTIYYGHDLHFLRLQRESELTNNKIALEESDMWKRLELEIIVKADMSYYPSYIEEKAIHEIDSTTNVKAITAYVFDEFKENYSYIPNERDGLLFVGGFSHIPNIDAVKWFVNNIYPLINTKKDITVYIVGSNAPEEIKQLDGNGIVVKGFLSDAELKEIYNKCKIAIVPLRYGAGVKGKVIEAIYNGIPIVTTSVGAEGILGVDNIVKIADEPDTFANAVLDLYLDDDKLIQMAGNTQDFIKDNFSIEAAWSIIKDDFS